MCCQNKALKQNKYLAYYQKCGMKSGCTLASACNGNGWIDVLPLLLLLLLLLILSSIAHIVVY